MTPRANLDHLALSESGFLFDSRSGHTYTLNATGTHLLRALIRGEDRETILEAFVTRFEVPPAQAARDLDEFLSRLAALGLGANS